MRRKCWSALPALLAPASMVLLQCSGAPSQPASLKAPAVSSEAARAAEGSRPPAVPPRICYGRSLLAKLVAGGPLPPVEDSLNPRSHVASAEGAKGGSFGDAYKRVAPSTVLVQSGSGHGTGFVVASNGLVLTNYHVVQGETGPDFTLNVKVRFGDMAANGTMKLRDKAYEGIVVKADPVRDLALIRVSNPPDVRPVVLATRDPKVTDAVASIGQAGIGMLWAVKQCQIAAIGDLTETLSQAAVWDCDLRVEKEVDSERKQEELKKCEEEKRRALSEFKASQQGLSVQTDCETAPGDSGGPLVNAAGELVGVNQSMRSDQRTSSSATFHVHVAEVREFIQNVPDGAYRDLPDPWCDGGLAHTLEDGDLDGTIDLLMTDSAHESRGAGMVVLMDLDQDQFADSRREGANEVPFDAEVAILSRPDGHFVWYDRDNDGRFDLLITKRDEDASEVRAYRLKEDDSVERIDEDRHDLLDEAYVTEPAMKARFGHLAKLLHQEESTWETLRSASGPRVPDPFWAGGRKGKLVDADRNGRPDTVELTSRLSRGLLIDADENSLGSLSLDDDPQALLNERRVDAELSIVAQAGSVWAIYDTNGDGTFDLALLSPPEDKLMVATAAWSKTANGWVSTREGLGRFVVRPELGGGGRLGPTMDRQWPGARARDEGMGSVPNPRGVLMPYTFTPTAGGPRAVAHGGGDGYSVVFVDANQASKLSSRTDATQAVISGELKADFALLETADHVWTFYDTDGDAAFDRVLFGAKSDREVVQAYRLTEAGTLEVDPTPVGGPPILVSGFPNKKVARAFRKVASEIFASRFMGE